MRKYAFNLRAAARVMASAGLALLVAPSARAHIELIDPPPRYLLQDGSDNGIKSCPCGLGGSNRLCNVAQDGSDPDRSERVSRFEAGSTITLRLQEFINHAGRFRVAFDPEGADMADFNANILEDVQDPANASGMMWEIPITLPNMTCDNCTLQLVQAMEVDQNTEIADPASISSYYACVDIQLVAPGSLGGEPASPPEDGQPDPGMTGGDMTGGEPPGGDMTGGDMTGADMGSDDMGSGDVAGGDNPPGGDMSGSQNAGNEMGTPLIPAGSGAPMDSAGSTGAPGAATDPNGAVAMNGATAAPTGAVPGFGMAQPLPPLGDPRGQSSSSSGCRLPAGGRDHGALGVGVFGFFALLGLRRARQAASR